MDVAQTFLKIADQFFLSQNNNIFLLAFYFFTLPAKSQERVAHFAHFDEAHGLWSFSNNVISIQTLPFLRHITGPFKIFLTIFNFVLYSNRDRNRHFPINKLSVF